MRKALITIAFATLLPTGAAHGGFFYTFTGVGDVYIGNSINVGVFLNWTPDVTFPTNVLASPGLRNAFTGLRMNNTSVGTVAVVAPTLGADLTANTAQFNINSGTGPVAGNFPSIGGFTNLASISSSAILFPPATGTSIYVGSFRLTGTTVGSVTVNSFLRQPGLISGNYVLGGAPFTILDPFITSGSFTFNVVPEPGTLTLCGVGISAFGIMAWRRRRQLGKGLPQTAPAIAV